MRPHVLIPVLLSVLPFSSPVDARQPPYLDPEQPIEFAADGRVWFGALNVLDGTNVRGIDVLGLSPRWSKSRREGERYVAGYERDANGSTWLTVGEKREDAGPIVGLYVITPEAVAAAE